MKKVALIIADLLLLAGFIFSPIVPQAEPYEEITDTGGNYGVNYLFQSQVEIFSDFHCALYCFPQNEKTRHFNLTAIIVSAGIALAVCGYLGFRILKK